MHQITIKKNTTVIKQIVQKVNKDSNQETLPNENRDTDRQALPTRFAAKIFHSYARMFHFNTKPNEYTLWVNFKKNSLKK